MRGLYVDSGVWLASIDSADPLHGKARSILDAHAGWRLFLSELVLSEVVTLVRRELGAPWAARFGQEVLAGRFGRLV
ncbi:MAG: PIN domain-containing protein [Planctomycetes bacterium]|nr:PIN domain-containing protein [Planctomycetota bacterium]